YIRPEAARAIGLLPEVPLEKVRSVGNAAGAGARMLLVNRNLRHVAADVARGVEHVELSRRPGFQTRFADAMFFPEA
ncbi:MAG: ASKHA domain-containing protein, partial [Planctomycetota bacterium]|nr:ASKHA domain-containing protein [Planctomycetota bacterium]